MSDQAPGVCLTDTTIARLGGSTVAVEASSEQLQASKNHRAGAQQLEELTRTIGALRVEVQYYRDLYEHAVRLRQRTTTISQELQLAYYQDGIHGTSASDRCLELSEQLRDALDAFSASQQQSEQDWLAFWSVI